MLKKQEPHPDSWKIISQLISDRRKSRLEDVASKRTEHITLVLQGIHDPHNVSACIRTAEAMGIQNIHVIPQPGISYKATSPAKGARNWVDIHRYKSISECAKYLKSKNYLLYGAYPPSEKTVNLQKMDIQQPIAVVFGNEHQGLDDAWLECLDGMFTIPMFGMVESFNISVATAISLHHLHDRALNQLGGQLFINEDRQLELLNQWSLKQRQSSQKIIDQQTH